MNEWKYLYSEPFKARCAIAAWVLKDCPEVVELGGYKTPITEFLYGNHRKVVVIDPRCEDHHSQHVDHVCSRFPDFVPEVTPHEYGLLILGLEMHLRPEEWDLLIAFVKNSKRTVLGVAEEHIHSKNQFEKIVTESGRKPLWNVKMDLSDNDFDLQESAPLKGKRTLYVL